MKSFFNVRSRFRGGLAGQQLLGTFPGGVGFCIVPGGQYPAGYYPFFARLNGDPGNLVLVDSDRPIWVAGGFRSLDFVQMFTSGQKSENSDLLATWNVFVFEAAGDHLGVPTARRVAPICIIAASVSEALETSVPVSAGQGWRIGPNWRTFTFYANGDGDVEVYYLLPPMNPRSANAAAWFLSETIPNAELAAGAAPITRQILTPGNLSHRVVATSPDSGVEQTTIANLQEQIYLRRSTGTTGTLLRLDVGVEI